MFFDGEKQVVTTNEDDVFINGIHIEEFSREIRHAVFSQIEKYYQKGE